MNVGKQGTALQRQILSTRVCTLEEEPDHRPVPGFIVITLINPVLILAAQNAPPHDNVSFNQTNVSPTRSQFQLGTGSTYLTNNPRV